MFYLYLWSYLIYVDLIKTATTSKPEGKKALLTIRIGCKRGRKLFSKIKDISTSLEGRKIIEYHGYYVTMSNGEPDGREDVMVFKFYDFHKQKDPSTICSISQICHSFHEYIKDFCCGNLAKLTAEYFTKI